METARKRSILGITYPYLEQVLCRCARLVYVERVPRRGDVPGDVMVGRLMIFAQTTSSQDDFTLSVLIIG